MVFVAICSVIAVAAFIWMIVCLNYIGNQEIQICSELEEAAKCDVGVTKIDRFYVECVLIGYSDFTNKNNAARARLLADQYNLDSSSTAEELFAQAQQARVGITSCFQKEEYAKLKKTEKEEFDELNRYASFFGRNKKLHMLMDTKMRLLREIAAIENTADLARSSVYQQKEHDWATWGGIASGLAGTAAGISVAADMQAKNAAIREQNKEYMRAAAKTSLAIYDSASELRLQAKHLSEEETKTSKKLVSDVSAESVLKQLSIKNKNIKISKTGAMYISATICAKKQLYIFDNLPAYADGTIIAHILEDDVEIGTANLVLPLDGCLYPANVTGLALTQADPQKEYSLKFSATNLWLMET